MITVRDGRFFTASFGEFEIMNLVPYVVIALGMLIANTHVSRGDEPPVDEGRRQVPVAVEQGVAVVEKAARNYPTHRKCFACHHQTLPLLAVHEAREARVRTDDTLTAEIVGFTAASFGRQIDSLRAGENIGGRGLTVGYGLMTLRLAGAKPDELSDARATTRPLRRQKSGRPVPFCSRRKLMTQTDDTRAVLTDGRSVNFRSVFYLIGPILHRGVARRNQSVR